MDSFPLFPALGHGAPRSWLMRLLGRPRKPIPPIAELVVSERQITASSAATTEHIPFSRVTRVHASIRLNDEVAELNLELRGDDHRLGVRAPWPRSHLGAAETWPKRRLSSARYLQPEGLQRVWSALQDAGVDLPPLPDAPAAAFKGLVTLDPLMFCVSCASADVQVLARDAYRCRACRYEGGSGHARLRRKKWLARLDKMSPAERLELTCSTLSSALLEITAQHGIPEEFPLGTFVEAQFSFSPLHHVAEERDRRALEREGHTLRVDQLLAQAREATPESARTQVESLIRYLQSGALEQARDGIAELRNHPT